MTGRANGPGVTSNEREPNVALGDVRAAIPTGTEDPIEAGWFLTRDPLLRYLPGLYAGPFALGVAVALLIVVTVLLSPSTDSHFIYTDF